MAEESNSIPSLDEVRAAAERARAAFDWEAAIAHTGQALGQTGLPPETAYTLLDTQAEAHRLLGDLAAEEADREAMARLAVELGDPQRQTRGMLRRSELRWRQGAFVEARRLAQAALDAARALGDVGLEAAALLELNAVDTSEGFFDPARERAEQAVALFHSLGDASGEARALFYLAVTNSRQERVSEALAQSQAALDLFRSLGDREGEARALNSLGIACPDLALKRAYYERALAAYDAVGSRRGQAQVHNNLALTNAQMGLYALAREDAAKGVAAARRMGARVDLAYYLDTLARVCVGLGEAAQSEELNREGMALSREVGDAAVEAAYAFGLGRAAHTGGRLSEACELYRAAAGLFGGLGIPGEQGTCLAWLGAAYLDLGEVRAARDCTAQAAALLESVGGAGTEYPPQEIWWWHYQALAAGDAVVERQADEAWHALDRAREVLLAGIANLSDDGLRRNYLNKVAVNRQIVGEWLRQATSRGMPLAPLTEGLSGPAGDQEQFRRMLDIGLRLNARHETANLARFIVDQVVELTGAERVALYRLDGSENRHIAVEFSVPGTAPLPLPPAEAGGERLLDEVSLKRMAALRHMPPGAPELEQYSQLCVPLLAAGRLVGLIFAEMAGTFGRFSERDRDLLTVLANQAAVALENAAWAESLEHRVAERTAELQAANAQLSERTSELEVINRTGTALARQLDAGEIIRLVGEQAQEIFGAEAVNILLYDAETGTIHDAYSYDRGDTATAAPFPLGKGLTSTVIRTGQPLLLGTDDEQLAHGALPWYGGSPREEPTQSYLGVPIVVGERVRGVVSVQSYRRHAYDEASVRLLSTLSSSMGVALENARLFAETNRLLDESRQRAAELSTVNRIGQALASQLDPDALIQLVGEQIRTTFHADIAYVALLDRQAAMIHFPYMSGQEIVPLKLGEGLTSRILLSGQPLLINQAMDSRRTELGVQRIGVQARSYLGVPIMVAQEAIGVLSVQSTAEEGRFDEDDLRLLGTIAASVGAALQNARLYQETQRRAVEMAALAEIGSDIASTHEMEPVLERLAARTRDLLRVRDIALFLVQPDGHTLRAVVALGKYVDETKAHAIRIGQGITGHVAKSGIAEIVNCPEQDPRTLQIAGTPSPDEEHEVLMEAPLISRGRVIGVMAVWRDAGDGQFAQPELDFLVSLARQAAIAIESARLYAETERRATEMAALAAVGREISATLDRELVLERIAGQALELLAAGTGAVYLLQPDGYTLKPIAATGDIAAEILADESQLGSGIIGTIVQSGVAERVNDTSQDPRGVHIPGTDEIGAGEKLMVAPLLVQGRAIGALAVWRDPQDPPFDEADLSFAIGLAQQAAVALENARLFAEVQTQRQFSDAVVRNSPVAIVTAGLDNRISSWNPAAERLFGYSEAEATGQILDVLVTTSELHAEAASFTEQTLRGGSVQAVTQRRRKDGTPVDVELLSVPVRIDGHDQGYLAIYHDVTDLKQAVRATQESERRMADIINFLPDATLVIDRDGRVIAWNRALEEMTGVGAADILGKDNHEYALPIYGERRPILIDLVLLPDKELEARYIGLRRQGATLTAEALAPLLRGRPAYLYASASALRNSQGEIVGAIETIRDITDRKRAEEELRQAKAAAESATQAKSAFLATMSHEIRTPMNAVIGMTSLLLDTALSPEQRDFAETIRSSGDGLLTIINDILDFSKIEAGRLDLESAPFDLRECVEGALDLLAPRFREKSLNLAYLMEPDVPAAIMGDVTRLRQILVNLIGNAVKFTDQGEVVVSVTGRGSAASPLHFAVRDTGVGIPPDRMDRLFQSFSQVDSSTTRRYGGTGLGLAISHRLAEMMGGSMWAESAGVPGQGSTFHFTIQAQPASLPTRSVPSSEAADLEGRRVLIVDDNATNRRILTLQTQGWGMVPRATGAPAEALGWLRQGERFDVALIDRQMPDIDGLALASEIHTLNARVPLIMVSSLGQREVGAETVAFAAFLLKPIKPSQLYNALVGLFAKPSEAARPAEAGRQFDAEMGKRNPLRILLAEDNAVNQKLALRLLDRLGYRTDLAANGLEAVHAVERQPYDVVFMDIQMPEMDGLEATRAICARWAPGERPRIVAMTANALAEDREACLAAGMDDYLAKPIRVEELIAALSRCQPLVQGSLTAP